MAEQLPPCPGCGGEPFVDQPHDGPFRYLECNECSFRAEENDWQRRVPGPATKDMLAHAQWVVNNVAPGQSTYRRAAAFLAEWPKPAPASPWKCCVCGEPVRIADDMMPRHIREDTGRTHAAELSDEDMQILVGWAEPATPPASEQPALTSPWHCAICGQPVRIADDLRPYHLSGPANHEAELSSEDLKTLANGLKLTD